MKSVDKAKSKIEVEFLFHHARMTTEKVEKIYDLCRLLGRYTFLDRVLVEKLSSNGIGMDTIEDASRLGLVTEAQENSTQYGKKNIFYFNLATGGINFLHYTGDPINDLFIAAGRAEKSRLLTANYYFQENNIVPNPYERQDKRHRYFFMENEKYYYFSDAIWIDVLTQGVAEKENEKLRKEHKKMTELEDKFIDEETGEVIDKFTSASIKDKYSFIDITKDKIPIGNLTRTVLP